MLLGNEYEDDYDIPENVSKTATGKALEHPDTVSNVPPALANVSAILFLRTLPAVSDVNTTTWLQQTNRWSSALLVTIASPTRLHYGPILRKFTWQ